MIGALLDRPLLLQRPLPTTDGRGGWIEGWDEGLPTRGRLGRPSGRDLLAGGRVAARVTQVLYLPPEAEARVGDRVLLDGRSFRVAVVGLGRRGHHQKLLLEEWQEGSEA